MNIQQSTNAQGEKLFVVVKNAGPNWQHAWEQDPKETGVIDIHNASHTYTGKLLNAPSGGLVHAAAEELIKHFVSTNPAVEYGVCPLLEIT